MLCALGVSLYSVAAILVCLVSESLLVMGKNDFCCAHGCSNSRKRNPDPQFYRIPVDLSRRKAWLKRIRRENFTPTENTRICSEHFVGGAKSDDPEAKGYVPSIFSHCHSEIYSNCKSHTTFKFLVAISACAAIVYISRGWGGRTSDKYKTANSVAFIATLEELILKGKGDHN